MGWVEARDQIATIIAGTTPTTVKRGLPPKFKHQVEGREDGTLGARGFVIFIREMGHVGQTFAALQRKSRYECDIVIEYPNDIDETLLMEAIALDHEAIADRLPQGSLWNRPTSTIESLFLGDKVIVRASVDVPDQGPVRVAYHLTIEFKRS